MTQSTSIESLASTRVADPAKADDMLTTIDQKDGFTAQSAPLPAQQTSLAKLETLNGMAFDTATASMRLKERTSTVALVKKEKRAGSHADLKSFASDTLTTHEQHLAMGK